MAVSTRLLGSVLGTWSSGCARLILTTLGTGAGTVWRRFRLREAQKLISSLLKEEKNTYFKALLIRRAI